jgi:hypothetical protein
MLSIASFVARRLLRLGDMRTWILCVVAACGSPDDAPEGLLLEAISSTAIAPIDVGNALTLPAQRHLVRVAGATLLALQQDGAGGHMLGFYRSHDGTTWRYLAPIQDSGAHRDEADVLVVGDDLALVYSYEGPTLSGSTLHDVYFQWWRYRPETDVWAPGAAVRVFDSTSDAKAYSRGELAIDSKGRIWVHAFKLESDGSSTARIAVSGDGGASFQPQSLLASLAYRGGGRLISLGSKLLFVYDSHDPSGKARFRVRDDGSGLDSWGATQTAWTEGIYHGAALSAVADGSGGLHIVYKDKSQLLWYRHFDGAAWGARQLVEDQGNWELQPAITRVGSDVAIFYNRVIATNTDDEVRWRTLHGGALDAPAVLDGSVSFKGYPAAIDVLPAGSAVPVVWGVTPDASSGGNARAYWVGSGSTLFSDSFSRSIPPDGGLGGAWTVVAGLWYDGNGYARADASFGNLAIETVARCADCRVEAEVIGFGTPETGLFLRASPGGADRYEAVLLGDGRLQIRRVVGGSASTLASVASGVAAGSWARIGLGASGSTLTATVNGVEVARTSDGTLAGSGLAGLRASSAGPAFDDFTLSGL